jgi:hypothetical protein
MFFQKHVNMAPQRKRCVKISSMFLLSLFKQIYKSAPLGLKNLEKESKNGTRLVLRLAFAPKN